MSVDTPPVPLADRLAGLPDVINVKQLAEATGVSESTARNWTTLPGWPDEIETPGRQKHYPRVGAEGWLRDNEAGRIDVSELVKDPDLLLTLPEVAKRTGLNAKTVSTYPNMYGPSAKDPFPEGDGLGRRRAGDVAAWLSRRSTRGGARATTSIPQETEQPAPTTAASEDVIDINGIAELTGRNVEAIKSLMRRPELAAMSIGKIGRSRFWPRLRLLTELTKLGYITEPREATADELRWLSGAPQSASELAEHYGVTLSAISKRIKRAQESDDPSNRPPGPVDPGAPVKRYHPREFDTFWKR